MWWLELTRETMLKGMAKSAMVGAFTDGLVSTLEKRGPVGVVRDMGCGVTTGAVGAATTLLFREYIRNSGPFGLIVGASASVATRYAYRSVFGPKLKNEDEEDDRETLHNKGR